MLSAVYAVVVCLCVCVCVSVTLRYCIKTAKCMITQIMPHDSPETLALKENWTGLCDMPLSLGQTIVRYLNDLRQDLEMANSYATEHGNRERQ